MKKSYSKLTNYLFNSREPEVMLSYAQIEAIIKDRLPDFVHQYPHRFFYNNKSSSYFKYWHNAGYIARVDPNKQAVTFIRIGSGRELIANDHSTRKLTTKKRRLSIQIPNPSPSEVDYYLRKWDSLENYVLQERSLDKLFFETYPHNKDISDILIKASALNDFYSTNVYAIFVLAKHIHRLDIDARLQAKDPVLVNQISRVAVNGKTINFYSFATKYCSHHNPIDYPIYDDFVRKTLRYFSIKDDFYSYTDEDLKDYRTFKIVLTKFSQFYGLVSYSFKDIDKYLWQLGKQYFPKTYSKRQTNS